MIQGISKLPCKHIVKGKKKPISYNLKFGEEPLLNSYPSQGKAEYLTNIFLGNV